MREIALAREKWHLPNMLLTWQALLRLLTVSLAIGLLYSAIMFVVKTPEIIAEYGQWGYAPLLVGGTASLYITIFFLRAIRRNREFKIVQH